MKIIDTLFPLWIAAAIPALVFVGMGEASRALRQHFLSSSAVLAAGVVWLVSFAVAMALVFPIMFVVPSTRRPSWWQAGLWGSAIGLIAAAIIEGRNVLYNGPPLTTLTSAGALAGMAYAVLARRRPRIDQA